ncbi:MAG: hypothetical protein AAFY26_24865, partial [Cyanobacteria bacterium J06638_22]
ETEPNLIFSCAVIPNHFVHRTVPTSFVGSFTVDTYAMSQSQQTNQFTQFNTLFDSIELQFFGSSTVTQHDLEHLEV